MSQEQIQLPEPAATVTRGPVAFFCKFTESGKELRGKFNLYTEEKVRFLIAEAVAAEREACAMACVHLHNQGFDDLTASPTNECAAAIRARTSAPKTAEQACIQGLRNVIAEDTKEGVSK